MKYKVETQSGEHYIKKMASEIKAYYKSSGKSEIIICNIGTSKFLGDSVAPLVGSLLRDKKIDIKIYGNLDNQINGACVEGFARDIKKYRDALIIAIDSAISTKEEVGTIKLRTMPVNAGLGVRGVGIPIGELSIVAITSENKEALLSGKVDLKIIYNMAENISKIIVNLDDKIKRSRRRCSKKSLV